MAVSNFTNRSVISITSALLIALSTAAFAAAPPASPSSAPTKEMREKMALVHEQMAACLRSDKSISECRTEMQKKCHDMMGGQGCTSMMGMGRGMMGAGHGMHRPATPNTPSSASPPN